MSEAALRQHVDTLLRELMLPENRKRLEAHRFFGSTNRVYKIPIQLEDGKKVEDSKNADFIIVKLLAPRHVYLRKRAKQAIRNLLYGEHIAKAGAKRVQLEIAHCKEWREAGLCVPEAIETSLPGARVFRGLPYPTFYTLLASTDMSLDKKLEVLAAVVRSLSGQHETALERGRQSLVHGDPGPWNIMFALDTMTPIWFDLEHPDTHPGMTLEDVVTRSLRIFVYGVLDQLPAASDQVFAILAENYQLESVLWRLVESMQQGRGSLFLRLATRLGLSKDRVKRRKRIANQLTQALHLRDLASSSRSVAQGVYE